MRVPSVGAGGPKPAQAAASRASPTQAPPPAGQGGFLRQLVAGALPLGRVFYSEMLLIGTVINVLTAIVAFFAVSLGAPTWLGIVIFVSPIPYNLLLVLGVWRSAARDRTALAPMARMLSLVWLGLMFFI